MSAWDDPITHIRELEARLSRVKALADKWDDETNGRHVFWSAVPELRAALEGQ